MYSSSSENLLVIDTKDPLTVDEFQSDQTLVLLASDSVAYVKDQSMVIQPIVPDFSMIINKGVVTSFVQKIEPYFKFVDWAMAVLMPIGIFFALAFRLVYLFILALLIWGLARVSKINVGYKKAYQWGLHLMTLPLIVGTALWLIVPAVDIPFLFTVLALIMAALNLRHAPASVTPPPAL
jgi:hypothetical protein